MAGLRDYLKSGFDKSKSVLKTGFGKAKDFVVNNKSLVIFLASSAVFGIAGLGARAASLAFGLTGRLASVMASFGLGAIVTAIAAFFTGGKPGPSGPSPAAAASADQNADSVVKGATTYTQNFDAQSARKDQAEQPERNEMQKIKYRNPPK